MQMPSVSQYALVRQDNFPMGAKKAVEYSISGTSSAILAIREHTEVMEVYFIFTVNKHVTRVAQLAMLLSNVAGTNFYFNKPALQNIVRVFMGVCAAEYRMRQPFITWFINIGDEITAVEHRQACDVFEGKQFALLENSIEQAAQAGYIPVDESYVDLLEPFDVFLESDESTEPIIDEPDKNVWQALYTEDEPDDTNTTQTDTE